MDNNITLTEKEFKMLVDCGFVSGYKFAMVHGLLNHISEEQMKLASVPCRNELWERCKLAEKNKNVNQR